MHRKVWLTIGIAAVCAAFLNFSAGEADCAPGKLNVLIITVDDMNADSLGCYGCPLKGSSPRIDRLAEQCFRFDLAHVQVGNCMPSRNVMWSGLYPHNNGVEGFYQVRDAKHLHLVDHLKSAGYFTAIRHKVKHSTPYAPYGWDLDLDTVDGEPAHPKEPRSYGVSVERGIAAARSAGKPFCLMINVSDPHKPFYAQGKRGETVPDDNVPSHTFKPEEVPVPGFLFDDPAVRKELSHYYSSVRRADDGVGEVLDALKASGAESETLIVFLSDHGMALPFAKTQLYHHSTWTPLMVRWPGVTQGGAVDKTHMVSAVDLLPTLLDMLQIKHPQKVDGRSFAPLLSGKTQEGRDFVIKEYNENVAGSRDPMRAMQTRQYLYIFNAWSNGERVMATATTGTPTYRRLAELAKSDPKLAARHDLYQHRVVEELYDVSVDPDCLVNLVDVASKASQLQELRGKLENWMAETGDPLLDVFRRRDDAAYREAFIQAREKEAEARKGSKKKAKRRK